MVTVCACVMHGDGVCALGKHVVVHLHVDRASDASCQVRPVCGTVAYPNGLSRRMRNDTCHDTACLVAGSSMLKHSKALEPTPHQRVGAHECVT